MFATMFATMHFHANDKVLKPNHLVLTCMKRGRPIGSVIRQRLIDILYILGSAHGYELYKYYREIHPPITLRVVYYHLRKGAQIGEFHLEKIAQEKGDYSWGESAEKITYSLGPNARPALDPQVKSQIDRLKATFLARASLMVKKVQEKKHDQEALALTT
jgi:hypothetical protein